MKLHHWAASIGCALSLAACAEAPVAGPTIEVDAGALPLVRSVDERFQSWNLEMVEVTGGRFWAPYDSIDPSQLADVSDSVTALSEDLFEHREPIDLQNRRLRTLAAELGPAYIRVSGSWANRTYFQNNDQAAPATPPEGYGGVLTREQWRNVVEFAREVDGEILLSFAINAPVRDRTGLWTPVQARQLIDYTREIGGDIHAAQLFNEPNLSRYGGGPVDYDGPAFARDIAAFRAFMATASPDTLIVGPGDSPGLIDASSFLSAEPRPRFDAFNYHFYPAVSMRCAPPTSPRGVNPDHALNESYLGLTDRAFALHAPQRDQYAPGAPIWITETGGASCGGSPWHATFTDTFRYLDQMGRLAKQGVDAIFHNTLAASDYALLEEHTFAPRPSYWAGVLWHRLMDERVLDAGQLNTDLRVYAHCLRDQAGGVALVAINTGSEAGAVNISAPGELYLLDSANGLDTQEIRLNGTPLRLNADDTLPEMAGRSLRAGNVRVEPQSIAFVAMPGANNAACQ